MPGGATGNTCGKKLKDDIAQWHDLRSLLCQGLFDSERVEKHFYRQLLRVVDDPQARMGDLLGGYWDALIAAPAGVNDPALPVPGGMNIDVAQLKAWGLRLGQDISLDKANRLIFRVSDGELDTGAVHQMRRRRIIRDYPMDPALTKALKVNRYRVYRGTGQRDAVRVALDDDQGSTLLINLPTGVGKTLVIEALDAFSPSLGLTLVIVPTVGLAMDQGNRMQAHLQAIGVDHGGFYCWHSGLDEQQRADIWESVRAGRQRVLFSSPEAALTSLRRILVEAAERGRLSSVVIDEAHIVDHWGTKFRPDFQWLAALVESLRRVASRQDRKIRCVLLSATYGPKTVRVLQRLFAPRDQRFVSVHGSFLRPELQYAVREVSEEAHLGAVLDAIRVLPKPMIVYTSTKEQARDIYKRIRNVLELARSALFTGATPPAQRDGIISRWTNDAIDVVVATSAFGVGIDKANVRSVLHAAIPENIDRFYQEVGRSGRDGCAAQSLLVFHRQQFRLAKRLNAQDLITLERGRERWSQLWNHGQATADGRREITMSVMPNHLEWQGDENEKWNWRTLMLMQRAGVVDVELSVDDAQDTAFDSVRLFVDPLIDDHRSTDVWDDQVGNQREYEREGQDKGYESIRNWLRNPNGNPLCQLLVSYYTVEGISPEMVCSGCPACRRQGRDFQYPPTLGGISHLRGISAPKDWPTQGFPESLEVRAYYDRLSVSGERIVDSWSRWIEGLIERRFIDGIRTTPEILERIARKLSRGLQRFWMAFPLEGEDADMSIWRELVILPPEYNRIPDLGWENTPRIWLIPQDIPSSNHAARLWWQDDATAIPLNILVERLTHVAYQ